MADIIDPRIERYATEHSSAEPGYLADHAAATREAFPEFHQMMVGRLEGRFLKMLVASAGARRVLEIGTFTGYSALSMAEALPQGGRLVTCELDAERAAIARRVFADAGYGDVIEVRVGPALETVRGLEGLFDFCFIDADKAGYPEYYEAALEKLSSTGLMAVDNVLQGGRIVDPDTANTDTRVMQAFNDRVASDPRVECVMVPIRDGVTLVRRSTATS